MIIKQNNNFTLIGDKHNDVELIKTLQPGFYEYFGGKDFKSYDVQDKVFLDINNSHQFVKNSIATAEIAMEAKRNIGIALIGQVGTGKTDTIFQIAKRLQLPTIVCSTAESLDDLGQFLTELNQPAVVIINEFEKFLYKKNLSNSAQGYNMLNKQAEFLALLDGSKSIAPTVFLLTENSFILPEFINNRPGRVLIVGIYNYLSSIDIAKVIAHLGYQDEGNKLANLLSTKGAMTIDIIANAVQFAKVMPIEFLAAYLNCGNSPNKMFYIKVNNRVIRHKVIYQRNLYLQDLGEFHENVEHCASGTTIPFTDDPKTTFFLYIGHLENIHDLKYVSANGKEKVTFYYEGKAYSNLFGKEISEKVLVEIGQM